MTDQQSSSIVIKGLSKRYPGSDVLALNNVSIAVRRGEVYGFLGPNGAGKSTTIRILMNFINPSAGSARILGKDVQADSVALKRHVGYLSGDFEAYPKMTGRSYLAYMCALNPAVDAAYRNELAVRLKADLDKPLGDLSRGNRQKIGVMQAFMHQPDVLILDEPTSGLDPLMQEVFYELVAEAKARSAAVFVSSHILAEVQKMCDRVGIIRDGVLVDQRDISEMQQEAAQTFQITFSDTPPLKELGKVKGLKITQQQGNHVSVHLHGSLSPLFTVLAKHEVRHLEAASLDLEEVFLKLYQEEEATK